MSAGSPSDGLRRLIDPLTDGAGVTPKSSNNRSETRPCPGIQLPRTQATHSLILPAKPVHGDPAFTACQIEKGVGFSRFLFPSLLESRNLRPPKRYCLHSCWGGACKLRAILNMGDCWQQHPLTLRQPLTRMIRSGLVAGAPLGGHLRSLANRTSPLVLLPPTWGCAFFPAARVYSPDKPRYYASLWGLPCR